MKFTMKFLKDIDGIIRNAMNISGSKHTNLMNAVVYLPRIKGGRGLKSLEQTYKEVKVKVCAKLINTDDRRLLIVKQFHSSYFEKPNYSIIKEANKYIEDIGLDFEIAKESWGIFFRNKEDKSVIILKERSILPNLKRRRDDDNIS